MEPVRNILFNTAPKVIHNPWLVKGNVPEWWQILDLSKNFKNFKKPDDLTIITWNNKDTIGTLEANLTQVGVPYIVLGKDVKKWQNVKKLSITYQYLKECKTKYVMCLDNFDVVVVRDLSSIIEEFEEFKCKILYNSEGGNWPLCMPEEPCEIKPFKYLNSGCFIGETTYIADFLKEALFLKSNCILSESWCDQPRIKTLYIQRYPEVQIDCKCKILQTLFGDKQLYGYTLQDIISIEDHDRIKFI